MGPDCTEIFFFLRAAATRGISFLLYQSSDVTRCHGGQGSPCSGHSWSGRWQWGWLGDRRSVHTGHGSVMKTNQVICIDFCSQEENRGSPPERARQLSELSPQLLLRLLDLVLFSSS